MNEQGTDVAAVVSERKNGRQLRTPQEMVRVAKIIEREITKNPPPEKVPLQNPHRAEMAKRARKLYEQGLTYREVGYVMGISHRTVARYLNDPTGKASTAHTKRWLMKQQGKFTKEGAQVEYDKQTKLPVSRRIRMRPVWQRRQRRLYGSDDLAMPNADECRDAIRVLGDEKLQREAPALYYEAFRIFDEAGQ